MATRGGPPETWFKKGYDERRCPGKPRGAKSIKTLFREVIRHVGKDSDIKLKIIEIGCKKALEGDYRFWKEFMDRLFGKPKKEVEMDKNEEMKIIDKDIEKLSKELLKMLKEKKPINT